ncbi:MAG: hypothetical protein LBB23_04470 [Rickettsiales bacterium]|nr:hypothetical protein [Rickettsiales bacterium]
MKNNKSKSVYNDHYLRKPGAHSLADANIAPGFPGYCSFYPRFCDCSNIF